MTPAPAGFASPRPAPARSARSARAHGRHVAETMTRTLSREQLVQLRDLCRVVMATDTPIEPSGT